MTLVVFVLVGGWLVSNVAQAVWVLGSPRRRAGGEFSPGGS